MHAAGSVASRILKAHTVLCIYHIVGNDERRSEEDAGIEKSASENQHGSKTQQTVPIHTSSSCISILLVMANRRYYFSHTYHSNVKPFVLNIKLHSEYLPRTCGCEQHACVYLTDLLIRTV